MTSTKEEWYRKRLKEGFFIFNKNEFPAFTETSYDPIIFTIINSTYKGNPQHFYDILEPHIFFDNGKKDFGIDSRNIAQLKNELASEMPLKGIQILEIEGKEQTCAEFLRSLGAEVYTSPLAKINENNGKRMILTNYNDILACSKTPKVFDITLSNGLLNNDLYIKYNNLSGNFCGLELYTIFANLTKKNGYSIHANGGMVTSLFMTFFQFVGLQTIDYFRHSDGQDKFMIIMRKMNSKVTDYLEFNTIYTELKKRNPIRYA